MIHRWPHIFRVLAYIGCFGLLLTRHGFAEPLVGGEYEVKAGFIYNFIKYTRWPEKTSDRRQTLVLCIVSDTPESRVIFKLHGLHARGKKILVRQWDSLNQIDAQVSLTPEKEDKTGKTDSLPCNVLFFSSGNDPRTGKILKKIGDKSILTIGEAPIFISQGGIINFFTEQNRLRFRVNVKRAEQVGLKFRSQLLMSAEVVEGKKD